VDFSLHYDRSYTENLERAVQVNITLRDYVGKRLADEGGCFRNRSRVRTTCV